MLEIAALDAGDPTGDASEYDDFADESGAEAAPAGEEAVATLPGDVVDIGSASARQRRCPHPRRHPRRRYRRSRVRSITETAFIFGADLTALPPQPFH